MTEQDIDGAARRAYHADCAATGKTGTDEEYAAETERWRSIALAVSGPMGAIGTLGQLHENASTYVQNVFEMHGLVGIEREVSRLLRKMDAAAEAYHPGTTRDTLRTEQARARIALKRGRGDVAGLALELDGLCSKITAAQRTMDKCSKASAILFLDEDKWDRYPSYQAYMDHMRPTA